MRLHLAHSSVALTAVACSLALGCAKTQVSPAPASASVDESLRLATVPSGVTFHARLDLPLSSERARRGQTITAHLVEPLLATDGRVVAPPGTRLVGHVIAVDHVGLNRVVLQFDGIVLDRRVHPVRAQVMRIESARVAAAEAGGAEAISAEVYPRTPEGGSALPFGGGPPARSIPVELPAGADLQLYLVRPFMLQPQTSGSELQNGAEVDRTFGE